jgi:hypothetical protein
MHLNWDIVKKTKTEKQSKPLCSAEDKEKPEGATAIIRRWLPLNLFAFPIPKPTDLTQLPDGVHVSELSKLDLLHNRFCSVFKISEIRSADFSGAPLCLDSIDGCCVFLRKRRISCPQLCRDAVGADLTAGSLRLIRRDIIAVTGIVSPRCQKISPAVVAATWCVAVHQAAIEIRI